MRIRLLGDVQNGRGVFAAGGIVDWPDADAQPLVDIGAAELVTAGALAPVGPAQPAEPAPPIAPKDERRPPPIAPPQDGGH